MTAEKTTPASHFAELAELYFNLPFNHFLGLSVKSRDEKVLRLSFKSKQEFIGNTFKNILHGGIISSAIDACGGLHAMTAGYEKMRSLPKHTIMARLKNSSTIDLRVDYLRPGRGQVFTVTSELLRSGKRISVARMTLTNEEDVTIAVGSATYLIEAEADESSK